MELKKECIGVKYPTKIGYVIIEDNIGKFELYKLLKLDVFKPKKKVSDKSK